MERESAVNRIGLGLALISLLAVGYACRYQSVQAGNYNSVPATFLINRWTGYKQWCVLGDPPVCIAAEHLKSLKRKPSE
jgi:hypothetical protein